MRVRIWVLGVVGISLLACVGSRAPVAPIEVQSEESGEKERAPIPSRPAGEGVSGDAVVAVPEPALLPVDGEGEAQPEGLAEPLDATRVLLDRTVLEQDLANVESVSEVIGLRPHITLHGIDGFKVTELPEGSPLAGIGLREGDVVHSVNGHSLDSIQAAWEAGAALQDATVLEGVITRNGREKHLVVRLE